MFVPASMPIMLGLLAAPLILAGGVARADSNASPPARNPSELAPPELPLAVVSDFAMSSPLQRSRDVRWSSDSTILLAGPGTGVVRVPVAEPNPVLTRETVDGNERGNSWYTSHTAATTEYLVFAAEVFVFGWKERSRPGLRHASPFFEYIEDLDAFEDRYAILGLHRREDGAFAPGGNIAWTGRLSGTAAEPSSLMVSASGPGAPLATACPHYNLGALRYLPDGSLVVVPGFETGAFRFDPESKLIATWDTEALGIGADCTFSTEQELLLARDPHARWAYLKRYRTVDEILILDGRPTLVVRRVEAEGTRWELITLETEGRTSRRELPISSPSKLMHLRGDTLDDRIVLLIFDEATFLPMDDPVHKKAVPTRLVVLESSVEAMTPE